MATGIAQRYPNGEAVWVNTPALQTNFSPQSVAYWQEVHAEMAGIMSAAGMTPYLQFGEVQWWYFAAASSGGMPFYDAYATSTFQSQYGRPMATITSENEGPAGLSQELAFLQGLIGQFTSAIRQFVRQKYPTAKFEVLYPPDTNDTALNQIVNFPTADWTPANLACLKTENFTFTGDRNLDQARQSISLPGQWDSRRRNQSPGRNQRLHHALDARAVARDRGWLRVGGAVRARSVLSCWIWVADEYGVAASAVHGGVSAWARESHHPFVTLDVTHNAELC